ncbi:hypothetical protein L6452_16430 [Arctium lappa]|uniref:Uncharacterized protein n=1 Tax=Arctium lappa TaxID=4217 RepID=A0ACB9C0R6_ARCLA|nr:hypothetical protein L6452_16430 [Arctium lappa]
MGNRDTGYNNIGGGAVAGDGEAAAAFLESDVGLGINMQQHHSVSSYHFNKMNNFMPSSSSSSSSPYFHHDHLHKHQASTDICAPLVFHNQIASGISLEPSTGSDTGGKVLFTATQWQELERQTMIYKYIMASVPVPPQLLIPLSTQSNKMGIDLRFSSGSDPEPWRCRRTDGKKWRCSRDVAPDQKYCERHAHKSRPRSRKLVEIQSHNTNTDTTTTTATATTTTNAHHITTPVYRNTISNTEMLSAATSSYQHPMCSEWFMKSGTTTPVSSSNQQFQQTMHSPRIGSKRNHLFPQEFKGNYIDSDTTSGDASAGARRQHFIDAWSRSGGGGDNCSLTLSMQCSGGMDEDDRSFQTGVGMLDVERGGSGDVKSSSQWLNQGSWMGSPPGGPLAEALGHGIGGSVKRPVNVPSPHGHSGGTSTSSACENGGTRGHELSFIR